MQIRTLGRQPYEAVEAAMRAFTAARVTAKSANSANPADTEDELWLVEHDPVYTQGLAGRDAHVLAAGDIPVVRTDRGGQVTYHGQGQLVAYPLLDLKRRGYFVKEYVFRLEQALLDTLAHFGVTGHRVRGAPGIYVRLSDPFGHAMLQIESADPFKGLGKIAALGIKVSRHCSYHGLALNVAMDLAPFTRIDPCGHVGLKTIDLQALGVQVDVGVAGQRLALALESRLG